MMDALKLPYTRSLSLDRCDIFHNTNQIYPASYHEFQTSMESVFFKSELLLKCKLEFERLITIDLPNTLGSSESLHKESTLTLIFTGAMKSGRSSLINMLLNTKVLPTNLIGTNCCVSLVHPKSDNKLITVVVHDLDGWEVAKYPDLDIKDLPNKIVELQRLLSRSSRDKNDKYNRRIQVQLPHWFLKNINLYECPAIDGMYSFDEPFDIIVNADNPVMVYVIDASNGLMQWDRTFLSKIQHHWPSLPMFFVINHIDIQLAILDRDRGPRFLSISEKFKRDVLEDESPDCTTSDDSSSDTYFGSGVLDETTIIREQKKLVDRCKTQIKKLGYMLEIGIISRFAVISVKEFLNSLTSKEPVYWEFGDTFLRNFNEFLSLWFEHLLITSSLHLKGRINGVIDAVRYEIVSQSDGDYDPVIDPHLRNVKIAEKKIKTDFSDIQNEFEKEVTKSLKEQLLKHRDLISKLLPEQSNSEHSEIMRTIKPKLVETFENILLGRLDDYNIDDEMDKILMKFNKPLHSQFSTIYKLNCMMDFFQYELKLLKILQQTVTNPLLLQLPQDLIQTEQKWYKALLNNATRKILRHNIGNRSLTEILIDEIKVDSIIRTRQITLDNILQSIQNFSKIYKETYRMVRSWSSQMTKISPEIFKKLLPVDFVLKIMDKSFRKHIKNLKIEDLHKIPTFFIEFYDLDNEMVKCINIQSFTSLTDIINILCFERICEDNRFIMSHTHTKLTDNGFCLLSYPKMELDLLNAIQNKTIWTLHEAILITKQLLNAVKYLQPFYRYLHVDLLPENIILRKDSRDLYECMLFPYSAEISSIGYQYRSKRKFKCNLNGVVFQIGMVVCWILTNDIWACTMITSDNTCTQSEFSHWVSEKVLPALKDTKLLHFALNLLFNTEEYNSIDLVLKALEKLGMQ